MEWPGPAPEPPGESWDPVPDPENPSQNAGQDPLLVAARLALTGFESSGSVSTKAIEVLAMALRGSSETASKCSASWLVSICKRVPKTVATVLRLFAESDELARLRIMQAVYVVDDLPVRLEVEIVRRALRDSNALTRSLAGTKAQYRELRSLLPALTKAAATDPDPKTAASLAENIAFIRDGYVATPLLRKRYEVRVAIGTGVQVITIPERVVDAVGLPEIVRRVRGRLHYKGKRLKGNVWDPS